MKKMLQQCKNKVLQVKGFVLPFTLLIVAIMLLISVGISSTLMKQIYFSNIGRESQVAYLAADNALACAIAIEETYTYGTSGIFPSDNAIILTSTNLIDMQTKLDNINALRNSVVPPLTRLATNITDIQCAQSEIFNIGGDSNFAVETDDFVWMVGGVEQERGKTSSFNMKMKVANNDFRCAKVIVNKTASYKQIISQGYSRCGRFESSVERAVVYTTAQ